MKIKKSDIILIVVLLLIAAGFYFGYRYFYGLGGSGGSISISLNGDQYASLNLQEDGIYLIRESQPILKLDSAELPENVKDNHYNILEIKNGMASMISAGCPDLLCVHQKSIDQTGEEIVCLPNKVIIEVVNGKSSEVDDVAS